jgi:phage tail sheath gpL-like
MLTSRWRTASLALVAISVVGLAACSSGGGTSAGPTSATSAVAAPERPATAADVATGMRKIDQIAKQIAETAGTDKARAVSLDGQIEPIWKQIEDTVKQNDQDTYLAMEDSFAVLEKAADEGNAGEAAKGSAAVTSAVQPYLAKYSG